MNKRSRRATYYTTAELTSNAFLTRQPENQVQTAYVWTDTLKRSKRGGVGYEDVASPVRTVDAGDVMAYQGCARRG